MSITFSEDIAYSSRTRAAFMMPSGSAVDGKKFSTPAVKGESKSRPWSDWGENNDLPQKMALDIEGCGVLNAALDAKGRIATGKGLQPFLLLNVDKDGKEDLEWVSDSEIHDWLELNNMLDASIDYIFNKCAYGLGARQLLLSRDRRKINRVRVTDIPTARLAKKNQAAGLIETLYLCDDWTQGPGAGSEFVKEIPVLEESAEILDLMQRTSGYEFAMISRQIRNNRGYYPIPLWYSAKGWVDHARSIPALKNAMMKNQITVKYLVTISGKYWTRIHKQWDNYTPEKRKEVMEAKLEEIDKYLSGVENQYKSIFTTSYIDPVTKQEVPDIKIEVLDDKVKDGKLLPDSAAANSEILFALAVNPALIGAGQPGGAYANNAGGSNIREAYLKEIMYLERERRDNARLMDIVKIKNGWSDRLEKERSVFAATAVGNTATLTPTKVKPRLVFRYPSGVLTTLDTGKSTKGEVV